MADVIDAALTPLVESEQTIQEARDKHRTHVIQPVANTSVLALSYRESRVGGGSSRKLQHAST